MSGRDRARLWSDAALGSGGAELLRASFLDHRYGPHAHDEVVIAAFTQGAQAHRVGRHLGVAVPGDLMLVPPGETHTGEAAGAEGWSYRAFYAPAHDLADAADATLSAEGRPLDYGAAPVRGDGRLVARLAALHARIEAEADDRIARQQAYAAALAAVARRLGMGRGGPRPPRHAPRAVARAKALAAEQFADPALDVGELARAAELSPFHFMRTFRAATGLTAHAYVLQLRLREARRRLAAGQPAAQVAVAVGFADQSHLIRRFRQAFGVTPGAYARDSRR